MNNMQRIHKDKTAHRDHFIPEWAARRNMKQVDLVNETGIDKSLISKWWNKKVAPTKQEHILAVAGAFGLEDSPESIFRHPEDDWLTRFFQSHTEEEKQRAIDMLKLMFPELDQPARKTG